METMVTREKLEAILIGINKDNNTDEINEISKEIHRLPVFDTLIDLVMLSMFLVPKDTKVVFESFFAIGIIAGIRYAECEKLESLIKE